MSSGIVPVYTKPWKDVVNILWSKHSAVAYSELQHHLEKCRLRNRSVMVEELHRKQN